MRSLFITHPLAILTGYLAMKKKAKLGVSPNWPDVDGVSRLISDLVAATGNAAASAINN